MRILHKNNRYNHHPFSGCGASLYAGIGATAAAVQFRKLRILGCRFVRGSGFTIATGLRKGCFIAQTTDPTAEFTYSVPAGWHDQTVWIQVRTFWNDCENVHNFDPLRLDLSVAGALDLEIHGTGEIIAADKRDGGIYDLRVTYTPASHGVQPTELLIRQTAGPGSLADSTTPYRNTRNFTISTDALTDGASYTFALVAKNGATELQLDTITFTADAAGPPAATILSLTAY